MDADVGSSFSHVFGCCLPKPSPPAVVGYGYSFLPIFPRLLLCAWPSLLDCIETKTSRKNYSQIFFNAPFLAIREFFSFPVTRHWSHKPKGKRKCRGRRKSWRDILTQITHASCISDSPLSFSTSEPVRVICLDTFRFVHGIAVLPSCSL